MKELLDKYKIYIAVGVLLIAFFSVKSCVNKQSLILRGENKSLQEQVKKMKDGVEVTEKNRIIEKDSIAKVISEKEGDNKKLSDKITKLETKVEQIKNKKVNVPQNVTELVKYFNNRNNTAENEVVGDKVGLGETTAKNTVASLEEGELIKEILPVKDSIITNLKEEVVNLQEISSSKSIMLISAEKSIRDVKELSTLQTKLTETLNKENRKLRTKNTLNKILVPVLAVGGFYLGTKVKK